VVVAAPSEMETYTTDLLGGRASKPRGWGEGASPGWLAAPGQNWGKLRGLRG